MTDTDLRRVGALNLAAHSAHLHGSIPGARVIRIGDFQVADSGLADDTFNIVCRTRFEKGYAPEDVRRVREYIAGTGRPFSWWVADEADLGEAVPVLTASGFSRAEREEAMVLSLSDVDLPVVSAAPTVQRIDSAEHLRAYASVLAARWSPPSGDVMRFFAMAEKQLLREDLGASTFFLALADGRPAAGAEMHLAAGVAGIYGVATLASYRGRGLATALMVTALRAAKERGCAWAVLQATDEGSGIYRRLGFRSVGRCEEFAFRPGSAGSA